MGKTRVLIMGAAGRDFHNFNMVYRDNEAYEVVAFTATQIPDIGGRIYPPELAGKLYPKGIPIHDETELDQLVSDLKVDEVVFAYSDVAHDYVMHKASQVMAAGADYRLIGPKHTMLKSTVGNLISRITDTGVPLKEPGPGFIKDILPQPAS